MTDNKIIKALECCGDEEELHWCTECPYYDKENDFCQEDLYRDALDLINRQQAENKELKTENLILSQKRFNIFERIEFTDKLKKQAKSEAIKEFAKRLKNEKHICLPPDGYPIDENDWVIYEADIDNLVKEMAGEDK